HILIVQSPSVSVRSDSRYSFWRKSLRVLAAVTLLTIHPKPGGAHDYVMSREQLTHEVENLRSSLSAKEDALKQEIQTLRQQGADQARTIEQLTQVVSRQNHA
ncbi:hypothetical protein BaRGS_00034943, partial [Batillaria attramentaria]